MTQDRSIGRDRPGLRRPAAGHLVRGGRSAGRRHRRLRRPGRGTQRRLLPDRRHHERSAGGRAPKRAPRALARRRPTSPPPTRSSSASPRRSPRRRTRTSRRSSRPPRRSAAPSARASSSSCSRRRSRARPLGPSARCSSGAASRRATDFDLAFAPERVNPGDPASASKGVPRLVGATTPEATQARCRAAANINDHVIEMSSPDAAELSKLLENVFRNVNIAFVNQLALLCERMGLDVWEVINAAATKPFGFMKFHPGTRRRRATASRSTRTTWPGGRASSTSSTASSSSPATSTSRCRAMWSGWSPTH